MVVKQTLVSLQRPIGANLQAGPSTLRGVRPRQRAHAHHQVPSASDLSLAGRRRGGFPLADSGQVSVFRTPSDMNPIRVYLRTAAILCWAWLRADVRSDWDYAGRSQQSWFRGQRRRHPSEQSAHTNSRRGGGPGSFMRAAAASAVAVQHGRRLSGSCQSARRWDIIRQEGQVREVCPIPAWHSVAPQECHSRGLRSRHSAANFFMAWASSANRSTAALPGSHTAGPSFPPGRDHSDTQLRHFGLSARHRDRGQARADHRGRRHALTGRLPRQGGQAFRHPSMDLQQGVSEVDQDTPGLGLQCIGQDAAFLKLARMAS